MQSKFWIVLMAAALGGINPLIGQNAGPFGSQHNLTEIPKPIFSPPKSSTAAATNTPSFAVPAPPPSAATDAPAAPSSTPPPTGGPLKAETLNNMDNLSDGQKLGIGDRFSYRVAEEQEPSVQLLVLDSGEADIPYLGRVKVAGKTPKALAFELKKLLEKDYFYHATVIVSVDFVSKEIPQSLVKKSPGQVYITGQVKSQGPQDIPPEGNYTVSKVVMRAGGFGDFANKRKVKLVRTKGGQRTETEVDVEKIFDKGNTDNDPTVQPEDWIIVPQRLIKF